MSSFRFLHAADIHLDSPLSGLSRYEWLPHEEIRNATRRALDRLIETAIEHKVDFVILAGDLYDGTWQDVNTGLYMMRALSRLVQANIKVVTLSGNHDAQSVISRELPLPPGVDHFAYDAPQTLHWPDLGVALHGQSFRDRHIKDDMTRAYPAPVAGCFNIGVLHTSLSGYGAHETYAPCSVETLSAKNYDYWALGHVHAREIVSEHPWIVFPGVLQGRHIRETGACGCMLINVVDDRVQTADFMECDVVRWADLTFDLSGIDNLDGLMTHARQRLEKELDDADGRTVIARITLTGPTPLHGRLCASQSWREDLHSVASSPTNSSAQIAIEKIRNKTQPPHTPSRTADTGELDRALDDILQDENFRDSLSIAFERFFSALPGCVERDSLMTESGDFPIEQARAALRARLLGGRLMRFKRLDLLRYGAFQDARLDFPKGASDLHIIYGPNEAGKSTTLRAIRDFLFGFPRTIGEAWLTQAALLRVGATLEQDGSTLEAIRRRGTSKTLLAPDNKTPLDDLLLRSWLGDQNAAQFEAAWALDHSRLRKGGENMQQLQDDAGLQILAAGLGLDSLGPLTAQLGKEVDAEWKPTHAGSLIRNAASALKELQKSLRESTVTAKKLKTARKAVEDAEAHLAANQKEREALGERRRTLERHRRISIPYRQLIDTENALVDNPGPALSLTDCEAAGTQLQNLGKEIHALSTLTPRLAALDTQIQTLGDRPPILVDSAAIQALLKQGPRIEQIRENQRAREERLTTDGIWLAQFRERQSIDPTKLPSPAALTNLKEQLETKKKLETQIEDAERRLRDAARDLTTLEAETSPDAPIDHENPDEHLALFRAAIDDVRALGPLDQTLSSLKDQIAKARDNALLAYGALRPWSSNNDARAEELASVALPEPHTTREEARLWKEWDHKRQVARAEALALQSKVETLADELAQIRADGQAVSHEDLETARAERDARWAEMERQFASAEIPAPPVRQAFEILLKNADTIADRRHSHAEQSARLAELSRQHDTVIRNRDDATRRADSADAEFSRRKTDWATLLDKFAAPALPPQELDVWATRRDAALKADSTLRDLQIQLETTASTKAEALARLGIFAPSCVSEQISTTLSNATARLKEELRKSEHTKARHADLKRLQSNLRNEKTTLDALKVQQARWEQDWEQACTTCGYRGGADATSLADVQDARTIQTRYESEQSSQTADRAIINAFEEELEVFLGRYAQSSLGNLEHTLETAQAQDKDRLSLSDQRNALQCDIENTSANIAKLKAALSPTLELLGLDDPEKLSGALTLARQRAGLNDQLTALRHQILEAGGGRPLKTLLDEASQTDPSTLEQNLAELEAANNELNDRRDEAQKQFHAANEELRAVEGAGGAHELAAQIQETEAELAEHADRYVSLKLQQLMLNRLIEQARERAHGPLLSRAGALFSRLTLGAYEGLVIDDGSGSPLLTGSRPGNTALVHIPSMSEGTRDQLYLALRLASVEQALDRGIRLPFLADDLFITFDEERTRAGLAILAELSTKTQILFFTHHRYILNYAQEFGYNLEIGSDS